MEALVGENGWHFYRSRRFPFLFQLLPEKHTEDQIPLQLLLSGAKNHQRLELLVHSSTEQKSPHDPTGRRNFRKWPPDPGNAGPSSLEFLHVFSQQAGGLPQAVNPEGPRMEPRPQFGPKEYFVGPGACVCPEETP